MSQSIETGSAGGPPPGLLARMDSNGKPRVVSPQPIVRRPANKYVEPQVMGADVPAEERMHRSTRALVQFEQSLPPANSPLAPLAPMFMGVAMGVEVPVSFGPGQPIMFNGATARDALHKAAAPEQAFAKVWRDSARWYQTNAPGPTEGSSRGPLREIDIIELAKADPIAKAVLDVGTVTNFTSITGGQSLGYVSLDTRIARGTVRPDSFTLYQALPKSPAYQVVDYFAYIDDPGGALPGSATSGFSNVQSGTLATNAGIYSLQSINLKLMLDGRAVTLALMAQNNFVSVNEQENANSALTVLQTADWMCYLGNPNVFPNQFAGIYYTTPSGNIFDYQQFYTNNAVAQGWTLSQTLYNMIYEVAANIASWEQVRPHHACLHDTGDQRRVAVPGHHAAEQPGECRVCRSPRHSGRWRPAGHAHPPRADPVPAGHRPHRTRHPRTGAGACERHDPDHDHQSDPAIRRACGGIRECLFRQQLGCRYRLACTPERRQNTTMRSLRLT